MSYTLKQVISWTIFVFIAILIFLVIIVPIFIKVFFPNSSINSNIDGIVGVANTSIGFLSAGLGFFSIYQANAGNKQVNKILETVNAVSSSQVMIASMLEHRTYVGTGTKDSKNVKEWPKDDIRE